MFLKKYIKKVLVALITPAVDDIKIKDRKEELSFMTQLKKCGQRLEVGSSCRILCPEYISIGDFCRFGYNCRIEAIGEYNGTVFSPELIIGDHVSFEDNCHVGCLKSVVIEDGTMIASGVFITDHFHGKITSNDLLLRPELRELSGKPVHIGKNVWIGEHVSIMPGVTLGNNVIIGANSVVTHCFGENVVIAGCPARIIKEL